MTVYEITDDADRLVAFQIPDVGKRRLKKILRRVAKQLAPAMHLQLTPTNDSEKRVLEFSVNSTAFEVLEMWDGTVRYWVGPVEFGHSAELDTLVQNFKTVNASAWF